MFFHHSSKLATALFTAALIAGMASSAEAGNRKGPYVALDVGATSVDLDDVSGLSKDETDLGISIGAGYNFNNYVGVELGYIYMGEASATGSGSISGTLYGSSFTATGSLTATAEGHGIYLGPEFSLPLMEDKLKLRARGGLLRWAVDLDVTASGTLTYAGTTYAASGTASETKNGTDFYVGGGASYDLNDNFTLRADYTHYNDVWDHSVGFLSAGLVYNF